MSYGSDRQQRLFHLAPYPLKNAMASLYGWRERRRRHGAYYSRYFQGLENSQGWNTQQLLEHQWRSLKGFLVHAGKNSPYYTALFDQYGFSPERMTSPAEMARLPILSKPVFRDNLSRIISGNFVTAQAHWVQTGGTTGFGLRFPETWECFQREYAFRFHNYHCGGIELGDRWAICAGHPVANSNRTRPPFWVRDYSNNWLLMSSFHLTEANLRSYVDALARFQPDMIGGYPSSVYLLALANEAYGRRVQPKAVFTSSETLLDFQRKLIETSFDCKAYTYYGNGERSAFIAECQKGRLHLKLEYSLVEFLDDSGEYAKPGTSARMICTGFGNYATPLVRYDIGDVVVVAEDQRCECGRGGILLDQLVGRIEDYVITPDGRFVGPAGLSLVFKEEWNVRMAQIVQQDLCRILIRIVREPAYTRADEALILKEARLRLGSLIAIEFEYVNDIPRSRAGKFPFVVSKLTVGQLYGRRREALSCDLTAKT
jgi:phenylacetate-CoA ligase